MSDPKLESLEDRIKEARKVSAPEPIKAPDNSMSDGMRAGSEFLAHVFGGAILGYAIDYFFGTLPWGLIVVCIGGFATGVWSANKAMNKKG